MNAGQAHEKIHLAPGYGRFPDGCAFYLKVAGVNVRVSRETASAVLEACCRSGDLTTAVDEPKSVVRYDPRGLTVDIG